MTITFHGATEEVTGSCFLLETNQNKKILIDCGMFQGSAANQKKNFDPFPFDPKSINTVLVTHAHLDHSGRIPKLVKNGFTGPIYSTKGTYELMKLIWEDTFKIMSYDNKKFHKPFLFDKKDIKKASSQCEQIEYNQLTEVIPEINATWKDAGHIFGAAFIELQADDNKIVFSGDIGNENVPILKDTESIDNADYLLCESTYGDRIHETKNTRRNIINSLIKQGLKKGGTIMIPSFSLERTQELLYELNMLSEHENKLPKAPIFLDSPLSIKATKVYKKYPRYYDKEAFELYKMGDDFLSFPMLKHTPTTAQSKQINNIHGAKIIIAGSGMMTGGRILHHAMRYLPDPDSTLLIVGYQTHGTLGRRLLDGAKNVQILGRNVKVRCKIKAIGALSAHGDQNKLLTWIKTSKESLKKVFCVHGEPEAANALAGKINDVHQISSIVPKMGAKIELKKIITHFQMNYS